MRSAPELGEAPHACRREVQCVLRVGTPACTRDTAAKARRRSRSSHSARSERASASHPASLASPGMPLRRYRTLRPWGGRKLPRRGRGLSLAKISVTSQRRLFSHDRAVLGGQQSAAMAFRAALRRTARFPFARLALGLVCAAKAQPAFAGDPGVDVRIEQAPTLFGGFPVPDIREENAVMRALRSPEDEEAESMDGFEIESIIDNDVMQQQEPIEWYPGWREAEAQDGMDGNAAEGR